MLITHIFVLQRKKKFCIILENIFFLFFYYRIMLVYKITLYANISFQSDAGEREM